ncbi:MAG: transglycosylase SLT domain-containing protein [Gammaproteobacteria bacterium]
MSALLALMAWTGAWAAQEVDLAAQRELFIAADQALAGGDPTFYAAQQDALKTYPLYPYLRYRELRARLATNPIAEVREFLRLYTDSPIAQDLRAAWLTTLADSGRWADFVPDFMPSDDVEMACRYRQALLATGQQGAALAGIDQVWLSAQALPRTCDAVIQVWMNQGGPSRELRWRRFALALDAGTLEFGRTLHDLLAPEDRAGADIWLAVYAKPELVLDAKRFAPAAPHTVEILLAGVKRWARRDPAAAAGALDTLKQRYGFAPDDALSALERRIALRLAKDFHLQARARLAALAPTAVDDEASEWRVRVNLRQSDWTAVLGALDAMPAALREREPWRYWRARALEAGGRKQDAEALYRALAGERDYYGFLAADRVGGAYRIEHTALPIADAALLELETRPPLARAHELLWLGRSDEARGEWEYALRNLDSEHLKAAAKLAERWSWHDRAIATLARADVWNDLELRFPTPYRAATVRYAREAALDPAWVYAVMRQESLFRADVRSSAGALGLMQIMPDTGRKIADELNATFNGPAMLLQPDTNIRFGVHYLRAVLDRFQNNPVLASAAYNAGPERTKNWLPAAGGMAADIWVETIPFDETRKYVQRVLEYSAVYGWRLGQPQMPFSLRMRAVQPGSN